MADVRLTATNPEDSSVVPVACNEKGELKLEEPLVVEGPEGEKGEKGDPGDPFSGNFADNVSFGGTAQFSGRMGVNRTPSNQTWIGVDIPIPSGGVISDPGIYIRPVDSGAENSANYTAYAAGHAGQARCVIKTGGDIVLGNVVDNPYSPNYKETARINRSGGSAKFANNKAGFTEEGYLWCTTERGDTVMLEATVGGAGMWKEYTPPRSRLEQWAEKNVLRPKPEDSSQDESETTQ